MFGSDNPSPCDTSPYSQRAVKEQLRPLAAETRKRVVGDNARALICSQYGSLGLPLLRARLLRCWCDGDALKD